MHKKGSLDIKLIDFGLSKKWEKDLRSELIETGQNKLVGTIYYMAPEVVEKNYD
jgi:serine/threonine protein kinase